jgi:hypothetical protein
MRSELKSGVEASEDMLRDWEKVWEAVQLSCDED